MRSPSNDPLAEIAVLADMVRQVPDKLVAAQLELQRLCQWDIGSVSLEAKIAVVDSCRLLHASVSELTAALEYMNGLLTSGSQVQGVAPATQDSGTVPEPVGAD